MPRGEFECRQVVFWGTGTKRLGTPGIDKMRRCWAIYEVHNDLDLKK